MNQLTPNSYRSLQKYILVLLFFFLVFGGLFLAQSFLIPISFAALFAMLLLPLCEKFEEWGMHRAVAVLLCVLLFLSIIISFFYFLWYQLADFVDDLPHLNQKLLMHLDSILRYIEINTELTVEELRQQLRDQSGILIQSLGGMLQSFLRVSVNFIINFTIVLAYIFMFLFYRKRLTNFIIKITPAAEKDKARRIVRKTAGVTHHYLAGMLIVSGILAVLNTIGLMIIGIEHPVFLGFLAGVLNLIPFVGTMIGSILPILVALLTKDTILPAVMVAVVFTFNQYLEDSWLIPKIVGNRVRLNPMAAIMVLIIGGLMWGIAGMILFIPMLAIVKIIFDNVDSLKPYAYLIGEDPQHGKSFRKQFRKWLKK